MNIRSKLTRRFSIIVATILILFSLAVYFLSENYRREEFYNRLEGRAVTTARLLMKVKEVDQNLLRIIDENSIHALFEEKVLVFNENNQIVYSSLDDFPLDYSPQLLTEIRQKSHLEFTKNNREVVGISYQESGPRIIVMTSAYDRYGRRKLQNLWRVLVAGLLVGMGIIVISGRIFAKQSLAPLVRMNAEISSISAGNLDQRINEGQSQDEIGQMAHNFNQMLTRLEAAFQIQQQFVSNASHELRTPLAAISSQLQAALSKKRTPAEYQELLQSLNEDTRSLIMLTNDLLVLAQSGIVNQRQFFRPNRVDEIIFAAQTELSRNFPNYQFQINYSRFPDDENALIVKGNDHLLKTAFINLMDNACKFSPDHSVQVSVNFPNAQTIEICFADHGPGIDPSEHQKIFDPFYRSNKHKSTVKGYGIGLSLVQRIVELHQGTIRLESSPDSGTRFWVMFPITH